MTFLKPGSQTRFFDDLKIFQNTAFDTFYLDLFARLHDHIWNTLWWLDARVYGFVCSSFGHILVVRRESIWIYLLVFATTFGTHPGG